MTITSFEGPPREWLKRRRNDLGLSQRELAERVSVSPAMIQSLELGRRNAARETWLAIAKGLAIPPDQLDNFLTFIQPSAEVEGQEEDSARHLPATDQGEHGRLITAAPIRPIWLPAPARAAVMLATLLVGFTLGALTWPTGTRRPLVGAFTAALPLQLYQRCEGQTTDDPSTWDSGKSNDSRCVMGGGRIAITAGMDTILDASGNHPRTAPLLIRQVRGDFVATVRMEYDGGSLCCRHAGMGVRPPGDELTWMRISKDSRSYHIMSEGLVNGRTNYAQIAVDQLPVVRDPITHFRIERRGPTVTVSYSPDGAHWITYYTYVDIPLGEEVEVFLTAHAASRTPTLTATFSDWHIQALP